ncbi:ROK family transcriptional regulator [Actinocatenispora rupis]|uniref:Transcriptional regulator n=1 Tax=Actinocatenispora rupis TaxID=519421 RepID=A0A8J3JG55_9ACTN|nr:ROK family transcriptional regulator [Actinocatenispora rupis]GID16089.1 transcriptional regulator [Actinocatenispora rupis]
MERGQPTSAGGGPATPRTARLINDRAAYDLLLARGPLTRTQLRTLTGLSRPTVADLIDRLTADGLIGVVGEAGAERRGPNASLYGVVADRAHVAGIEVRADTVTAVRADVTGRAVGRAELPLDPDAAPDTQVLAALDAAGDPAPAAVVIGTPGLVDPATGDVSYVAALPSWHNNLLAGLRDRLDAPIVVDNEVNLAGLAEHRLGAARGRDTFALLSIGQGLGVAVVLNGQLLRGASGGAGEIGYIPYAAAGSGPTNLQVLAGGAAILALARAHGATADTLLPAVTEVAGDPDFLDAVADRIAVAAIGLCAVLDPGFLVLAGSIGHLAGTPLATRVATRLADAVPLPTEVRAGTVPTDPVVRGAVLTALDLLHHNTFPTP